ncbi:MAG: hypothetical protein AB1779_06225, partial [Candidatus Thermoplasmatota archaeon]
MNNKRRVNSLKVFLLVFLLIAISMIGFFLEPKKIEKILEEDEKTFLKELKENLVLIASSAVLKSLGEELYLEYINKYIRKEFGNLIERDYRPYINETSKTKYYVADFNITAKIEYMETIDLVRNVKELYYAGEINTSVLPSYISIYCSINFVIEKASKKNKENYLNKTWQEVLPYPLPFMKYKISQFERNAKFEFTDIGRIVR